MTFSLPRSFPGCHSSSAASSVGRERHSNSRLSESMGRECNKPDINEVVRDVNVPKRSELLPDGGYCRQNPDPPLFLKKILCFPGFGDVLLALASFAIQMTLKGIRFPSQLIGWMDGWIVFLISKRNSQHARACRSWENTKY